MERAGGGARQLHIERGDEVRRRILGDSPGASQLDFSEANIERVVDAIVQFGAGVVYAPWPGERDINQRTLALVAREAVRRINGDCCLAQYELNTPLLIPNRLIDVSAVFAAKLGRCAEVDRAVAQALNSFRGASFKLLLLQRSKRSRFTPIEN